MKNIKWSYYFDALAEVTSLVFIWCWLQPVDIYILLLIGFLSFEFKVKWIFHNLKEHNGWK